MRAHVSHRGHVGVSFGCLGMAVMLAAVTAAGVLAVALVVKAAVVLVPLAGVAVLGVVVIRVRKHMQQRARSGIRMRRSPYLPENRAHYVERDSWPHAVREGSWLSRH